MKQPPDFKLIEHVMRELRTEEKRMPYFYIQM